jgi:flagellar M-ring protein FliF
VSALQETIKNLGPARLAILGATFLSLIAFFVFVSAKVSQPDMSILYRDLNVTESAQVSAKLEEIGIPFNVSIDGAQVFVSENEVGRARMLLAESGLPNGGSLGFEIFDQQSGFGTTSFVQNVNKVRALQGELARTITTLDPVQFAKVHIVLPRRELFSRESQNSTASVTLKLTNNGRLARQQIYGIQNLVANAVPNLKPDDVTIIDTDANMLAGGRDNDSESMIGVKSDEMRQAHEHRLVQAIEDLVGRTVGINKVRATVSADLDFDRISTNDEIYDPEGQVVRSTQSISEDNTERDAQNNNVSVENNLPGLGDNFDVDAAPSLKSNRTEEITNFEISKTIRNTIRESGEITKLSVAVLVDGRYTTNEEGDKIYEPRSQEELDQIKILVQSAVGFDEDRGDTVDVVNMPFINPGEDFALEQELLFGFEKSEVLNTAEMVMLIVMGILVVMLVLRPLVGSVVMSQKAAIDQAKEEAAMLAAQVAPAVLTGPGSSPNNDNFVMGEDGEMIPTGGGGGGDDDAMIDMQSVEGKVKASSVKKVGEIVSSHPNETVSVIRNWMAQE